MSKVYYSYFRSVQNQPPNTEYFNRRQQLRISNSSSWNPCASAFNWVLALDESSKLTWYLSIQNFRIIWNGRALFCSWENAQLLSFPSIFVFEMEINCLQIHFLIQYKGTDSLLHTSGELCMWRAHGLTLGWCLRWSFQVSLVPFYIWREMKLVFIEYCSLRFVQ